MDGNGNAMNTRKHALHSFIITLYVIFYEGLHFKHINMYMFLDEIWNICILLQGCI
jgi:hypothetical protein